MPVKTRKIGTGKNKGMVRVSTPGGVKSKAATPENAAAQARLLRGIEHGWKPTGKPAKRKASKARGAKK